MTEHATTKTHWKAYYNPNYIGAYAFQPGEEKTLTIARIEREIVQGEGGREEECTVAHFVENEKPMILNRTNQKTIEKLYNTGFVEDWPGKRIQIYVTKTKLKKDLVDCLRIRPEVPPKTLPALTPEHHKWAGAVTALREGKNNIDGIKQYFALTPQYEKQLLAEAQSA